jgi:predicted small lipoprotein YifL
MKQASWILIVCASAPLAGCGMKGPLYLPDKNASVVTRPANSGATNSAPGAQPAPAPTDTTSGTAAPNGGSASPAAPTPAKPPQDKNGDDSQSTPKG